MHLIHSRLKAICTALLISATLFATGCSKATDDAAHPSSTAGTGTGTSSGGSGSGCSSVQCHGTTQSGARCARMTTNCSGYCWQH